MKQIKINSIVYHFPSKRTGELIAYNRDTKTAQVAFITNYNKETGERTTKLETVNVSDIRPSRKSKPKKYNPNEMYWMVHKFHDSFDHPIANSPQYMDLDRGVDRSIWTGEEALVEFIHQSSNNEEEFLAAYDALLQGLEKAKEKSLKDNYPQNEKEKIIGQTDALTDAMYFILGSFVEMGVKPFNLFKIVQDANMAKLHADGKPRYRDGDGKIIKPDGWTPPEPKLKAEIERQINNSK